jgi:hypothetical protein
MPSTRVDTAGNSYITTNDFIAATGVTPWYRFGPGTVNASIGSAATGPTAITATVQRSGTDPNDPTYGAAGAGNPTSAGAALTGSPAAGGIGAATYTEGGVAWYRFNVTAFTAGTLPAVASLSGRDVV